MKRTPLLITIVIILIVSGGIWVYQSNHKEQVTPWSLIGRDAAVVLEIPKLNVFLDKTAYLPALKEILAAHDAFQFLVRANGSGQDNVLIAFYPIQSDDFGLIAFLETDLVLGDSNFVVAINYLKKKYSIKSRLYNGIEITEYWLNNKVILSYAFVEKILVMSPSPFLLEGALRMKTEDDIKLFRKSNAEVFRLPTLHADEGNLYIDVANFLKASDLFLIPAEQHDLFSWTGSLASDIKIADKQFLMNGFLADPGSDNSIFNLFKQQQPVAVDLGDMISNRVAILTLYSIAAVDRWFEDQSDFITSRNILVQDSLWKELSRLDIAGESLRKSIGSQFASCYLPNEGIVNIVELDDENVPVSIFEEIASKIAFQNQDSLYAEMYKGYQIGLIDYKDFLYQLYYPLAQRASRNYFVKLGSHLLLSENVELLKFFIDDLESENTWGKSVDWNRFLASSLQESSLNLFFDGRLTGIHLKNKLNPKWRVFLDSTNFFGIDKGAIQLSKLESNYYVNGSFQFMDLSKKIHTGKQLMVKQEMNNRIIHGATVVRTHLSKDIEITVQDSSNNFTLLSKDFKVLWGVPVGSKIVSEVWQVDYFNNGKLQYFFATKDKIHLIDRLGRYVDGFPVQIDLANLEHARVVDYDMSKRYRYLLTDVKGDIYLRGKHGEPLEGWSPKAISGRLMNAARHYRILGHDYIVAIQQNGVVHVMNRRGEYIKGFPAITNIKPGGDFFVSIGNTLSSTYLNLVSADGLKIEIDWSGQVTKRDVLLKQTTDSQFQIVKSNAGSSFVILRIDAGKIALLDRNGNKIFDVDNPGSFQWQLTYLENRVRDQFYCLYDEQQNFSYVYNKEGKLMTAQPLESTQPPTLYFDEKKKELIVYNVHGPSLSAVEFPN